MTSTAWLARLQHDLVKRLLWPARDRRDLGGAPAPGELVPQLVDDEGGPTTAAALWDGLVAEAPAGGANSPAARALARFAKALAYALAAGRADDVAGVLTLEAAFAELARSLDDPST